ncbi:MAG: hypothetical protein JWP61_1629 [Friedmanniella sp.]|nr:hypothetical protein [Friedmanniella sp.]
MRKNFLYIVGGVLAVVAFAISVFILSTTPDAHIVPTPFRAIVGGVFGMMAALLVLVLGFIKSVQSSD